MTSLERRERAQALARELRLANLYEHQLEHMTALHRSALEAMESGQVQEAQDRLARHAQCQMRCRRLWQELQRGRSPEAVFVEPTLVEPIILEASPGPALGVPPPLVPRQGALPGRRTPRPPSPPLADPVLPLEGIEEEVEREFEALRLEVARA